MGDIDKLTPQNLLLVIQFVTPGFLAVYFRSLFVRRIEASFKDNVLLYVVLSLVYGFLTVPLWAATASRVTSAWWIWFLWLVALVIVPAALGIGLGVATQKGWSKRLLAKLKLNPLSPYRTGWDWAFSQTLEPTYVLVTLDDGSQAAGLFGSSSLAASDHTYRDLFIERSYDVDGDGNWSERTPRQSILIAGKSVRYVEFFGELKHG